MCAISLARFQSSLGIVVALLFLLLSFGHSLYILDSVRHAVYKYSLPSAAKLFILLTVSFTEQIFLIFSYFFNLFGCTGLSCSMWDLSFQHANS